MMERIPSYNPQEKVLAEEKKIENLNENKKEKISIKDRILGSNTVKALALFIAMMGSIDAAEAQNQSGESASENLKNKIEDARMMQGKLAEFVKTQDKSIVNKLGNTNIRTYELSSEQKVVIAENGSFTIISENGGELFLYDKDSDGSIDRVIINKKVEDEGLKNKKFLDNVSFASGNMDDLADLAEITSSSPEMRKEATIFKVNMSDKNIEALNMINAESGIIIGDEAAKMTDGLQGLYNNSLKNITNNIDKTNNN